MNSFIIRLLVNAAALWVAAQFVPGIRIDGTGTTYWVTLLIVAFIFGLVNALVKPIISILTLPLTILTLGLFIFVVNALMLVLTSGISDVLHLGFHVIGFGAALLGAIIITIISFLISHLLPDRL